MDTRRPPVRRRIPVAAEEEIRNLYRMGTRVPRDAKAKLDRAVQAGELPGDCDVSLKTIKRIYDELEELDRSSPWSLSSDEGDPRVVLRVLSEIVRVTEGARNTISNAEAAWVTRLYHAAPDIDPWRCYLLSRLYIEREAARQPTLDLDIYLAHSAWDWNTNYRLGVLGGLFPCVPEFLLATPSTPESRAELRRDALEVARSMLADSADPEAQDGLSIALRQRVGKDNRDLEGRLATRVYQIMANKVFGTEGLGIDFEALSLAVMAQSTIDFAREISETLEPDVLAARAIEVFERNSPDAPIVARDRVGAEIRRLISTEKDARS